MVDDCLGKATITVTQTCSCDKTVSEHTMTLVACQTAAEWLERPERQTTCGYCGDVVVTTCTIEEHAHVP